MVVSYQMGGSKFLQGRGEDKTQVMAYLIDNAIIIM